MLARLLFALPLCLALAAAQASPGRVALVIGNAAYAQDPLVNTRNDAADMAAKLGGKDLGFKVSHHQDLGRRDLARAIADFTREVQGSDAVALFYYSGHGLQVAGKNYLVPVDAKIRDERDVPGEAVPVDDLLAALDGRSDAAVNLIILDACRNNLFKRSDKKAVGDKGLARVNVPTRGTLILYATRPGDTATDNPGGRNGLFTQYLLAAMAQPGIQVEEAFKQAVTRVWEASGRTQSPWSEGGITGQFYFIPAPAGPVPPPPPLGHLQVSVDAPGAKVTVNGLEVGVAEPGKPLDLGNFGLGQVRVEVEAHGRQRVSQTATLQAGAWTQVPVALPAEALPAPAALQAAGGKTWTEPQTGMDLVWVPGGGFTMGCWGPGAGDCYVDEYPAHQVQVEGHWMAKTEVTQAQWQRVMGTNPSRFKDCPTCPVEQVSWGDVQAFIAKLDPGGKQGLRLPTEAEWEYGCRSGGKVETYCGGDDPDWLGWYKNNSGSKTHPVARKGPNGLGLYDMSGNVMEWTCSVKAEPYDGSDGKCAGENERSSPRVLRGGSWGYYLRFLRAASRYSSAPVILDQNIGFRLARTITP